jgi:hypothetical protein
MGNPLLAKGRLNRRAIIVRPSFTTNANNEQVEEPNPQRTQTWCSLAPGPGTERFGNVELAGSGADAFGVSMAPRPGARW